MRRRCGSYLLLSGQHLTMRCVPMPESGMLRRSQGTGSSGHRERRMDLNSDIIKSTSENSRPDVIFAVMKLTRSMRRRPPRPMGGCAPGMGRPLSILADNEGASSRELAELLDIRPSSLTEMLTKMESEGLVTRTADPSDRRVVRVSLTDKGRAMAAGMKAEHEQRVARANACFTDEEVRTFCEMCERLGAHLEALAKEDGEEGDFPPPPPHMHGFHHGCGDHHHGHHGRFPGDGGGAHHPRCRKLR